MASTSDRAWMYMMTDTQGYSNQNYVQNVELFLDYAYSHPEVVEHLSTMSGEIELRIKCPCRGCKNKPYKSREVVSNHLRKKGFMPAYFTWTEHGETSIHDVGQSSAPMDCDDHDDLYDCRRMVLDNSNVAEDIPNPKAKKFYDLLQALDESLWEGCQNWTTLQAATSLLSWKSHCNVPVSTFDYILPIFKSMLPKDNNLPDNFYANFAPEIPCSSKTDNRLSIFKVPSRRLFGGKYKVLSSAEMHKIYTYVLLNCVEVHESLFKFDDWIRETEPSIDDEELERRREALFASWFNTNESDYYGLVDEIIEVEYDSDLGRCVVVLFRCTWFDPVQGVKVDRKNGMVDIKHTKKGCFDDPYILALQAQQVYYTPYPCTKDWWAVVKSSPKGVFELEEDTSEVEDDDNHVGDDFFQENERLICSTNGSDHIEPFNLAQGDVEEIIMSSGRRRSGPRPSHGGSSGIGGDGQMLVDNHQINDDNDEGVGVTEPDVEASNAMRGSKIPNPLPEPADRPMISISADEFNDQKSVGHSITSILQFRFSEPWATWSCVPREKKDQMWLRFQQSYQWDPRIDEGIRKRFVKHASSRWNGMLNAARTRAIRLYEKNSKESKLGRPIRSTEFFTHTHAMKGTKPLDQPPTVSRSGGLNRSAEANRSAGTNGSAEVNGSAGENGLVGANGSGGANGPVGANGPGGANGSAGANGSVGSEASTSTGVGESNEVGESSGGQAVEPRWVNDKSRDHMVKGMVESHGENVESNPHDEELWNKVTPPNRGNTFGAYNAYDPIFLLTGTPSTHNASTSHPQFKKVEVLEKSLKDLDQARVKDKEIFYETIEQERKLGEEKLETFKEEMKKETNERLAEALAQLKEQAPTPHSA
ncbi:transposon, En/Spm-like, Transposase-associated domain protein [Artemisia annua]|uniref:Transposon, En/Spm-like, Transposase-associated domain protein n=1 Tax=Artemisia annua TaxID=35608 RepID=A0A2U1PH53_ARTAN|nr:transposon, En/Spm-like, Transposase-associated domain protein [Artemisia annua]